MTRPLTRPLADLKPHPKNASIYQEPSSADLKDLADSIKAHGLLERIVILTDGTILSGHRRVQACRLAGLTVVPVIVDDVADEDLQLEKLLEYNRQRYKTHSDRHREAMALRELLDRRGISGRTTDHLAAQVGIGSGRQLERIDSVVSAGIPKLVAQMDANEISPSAAADAVKALEKQPPEARAAIVDKYETGRAKTIKDAIEQTRQETNAALVQQAEAKPLGDVLFGTIVIYPNWDFADLGYKHPGPRGWYSPSLETVTAEQLFELEIQGRSIMDLLAEGGEVYLFAPKRLWGSAVDVVAGWGLLECGNLTWAADLRPQIPIPSKFPERAVEALVAVKGETFQTAQHNNWFYDDESRPGFLPERFYHLVEAASQGPYLQVYAQSQRKHWHSA